MAVINPTYNDVDELKIAKIKLGNDVRYIHDNALRAIVNAFHDAVYADVASELIEDGKGLVTAEQVYDFVMEKIGGLGTVLHLLADVTDHTKVASPKTGDFVVETDGKEWLYADSAWREIGDETAYVQKTFKIAGVAMSGTEITAAKLIEQLGLKGLAFADTASGSSTTQYLSAIDDITAAKAGTYNVSGTAVAVPQSYSELDVTPAGSVAVTSALAGENEDGNYTPDGNVSVTAATAEAKVLDTDGTAFQLSEGSVEKADDTTAKFATTGLKAAVADDDDEMLVFSVLGDADKADAVTAVGEITYTKQNLTGSLPTFKTMTVATGIQNTGFTGKAVNITADFTGTEKKVTPAAATTANAAPSNAQVTIDSDTIAVSGTKSAVSVTVSPVSE